MARYLLDTDICSYIMRNKPPEARARMNAIPLDDQCISVITFAELLFGVKRSSKPAANRAVLNAFLRHVTLLNWDAEAADHYSEIRATLESKGVPIGSMDMMIAAHARSLGAIIVTNNRQHFERVPGLKVETWL